MSGDATGTLRVVCEFLEEAQNPEADAHSFCSGSFDLEEGSVLAQGVTQTNGDIELPIVGGSGEFVGATGTLTSPQSGDDEPSINTLDLRLPKD